MDQIFQIISVIGAGLILLAFFLLQRGRWPSESAAYLWANFFGSGLLAVVAIWDRRLGFIFLEVAWALISLASIIRIARGTSPSRPT